MKNALYKFAYRTVRRLTAWAWREEIAKLRLIMPDPCITVARAAEDIQAGSLVSLAGNNRKILVSYNWKKDHDDFGCGQMVFTLKDTSLTEKTINGIREQLSNFEHAGSKGATIIIVSIIRLDG